jgi:hypothetical protein
MLNDLRETFREYANRTEVTQDKSSALDFVLTVMNYRTFSCFRTLQCLPDCNTACCTKKF